ncbi:hypothetical protein B0A55_04289 [Friedmanniomyces simplex]|uniref:FAD/NAD(P)-binding domain-containing protein n=1 Tax=Friedmanniomyces simplex TaxID=329884 RepID=A0A4U0WZJ4_9PEZI|nr:hypothetical protein B0A55_04289 [Friedmanniomyces simplex]
MHWQEETRDWKTVIVEKGKGRPEVEVSVSADYVFFASGVLANAKLPQVEGFDTFKGHSFHTARWDYAYTGGSPEEPDLTKLKDKRVAYIGTGATAIQSVPHLAKWSKELYIFQRTPSAVDRRNNRDTDPAKWKSEVATGEGWQRERSRNFHAFISNAPEKPAVDLVDDEWTKMWSYSALCGSPRTVTMDGLGEYVKSLHEIDYPRSERVRKRCEETVKDQATAEALQAWYPGWCKRPCFHDEYLPSFNEPNVNLVDTAGKGVERIRPSGPDFDGKVYDVDVIIWGTGFVPPSLGSPAGKAAVQVYGRDGISLESRSDAGELSTLHGAISRDFPNMFWPDIMTTHVARIIGSAEQKVGGRAIIEPTEQAVEDWAMQIAMGATALAGMAGCTPSYMNMEGMADKIPPEMRMKMARNGIWGGGIEGFCDALERWWAKGGLEGLQVAAVA